MTVYAGHGSGDGGKGKAGKREKRWRGEEEVVTKEERG